LLVGWFVYTFDTFKMYFCLLVGWFVCLFVFLFVCW
jgi:hypothetical protein